MGYNRGDSFPFDFEPNGILFGSKLTLQSKHMLHKGFANDHPFMRCPDGVQMQITPTELAIKICSAG